MTGRKWQNAIFPAGGLAARDGAGSKPSKAQMSTETGGFQPADARSPGAALNPDHAPARDGGMARAQPRALLQNLLYSITNLKRAKNMRPSREDAMPKLKIPNIDDVVAIDIHTHAEEPCGMHGDDGYDDFQAQMAEYFKSPHKHPPTVPETAAYYRAKKIAAVIFPVDAERETGFRRYNNDEMLEVASEHLDVLIPFVSIDPHKGKLGVREAKRLMQEFGVRGFKFHPTMQGFYANDRMAYPLYEAINDGGAIALFHTGQTGVGSGMPGGMGMRLKYSNPMYMDDVAADFPDLKIILAHPSFPWQEEALSVATHKPNVYIDLSGWSPKYFPPILVRYINSILQDKMLFGSDWPVITPDRWLADFAKLEIRDEIRPKVLKANARKILGI
jgi:predicted TIM-barrel fold metal-dependent hydrolase